MYTATLGNGKSSWISEVANTNGIIRTIGGGLISEVANTNGIIRTIGGGLIKEVV